MKIEQPYLPDFLAEEAKARDRSIDIRARQRHLVNMYWRFRKYATKCHNKQHDNMMSAWKLGQMYENQR